MKERTSEKRRNRAHGLTNQTTSRAKTPRKKWAVDHKAIEAGCRYFWAKRGGAAARKKWEGAT